MGVAYASSAHILGAPRRRALGQPSAGSSPYKTLHLVNSIHVKGLYGVSINNASPANPYLWAQADDLIVVVGSAIYNGTGKTLTADLYSGTGLTFTEIGQHAGDLQVAAWYAWQPDTTARPIKITTSDSGASLGMNIFVLRNADPTTPIDVAYAAAGVASSDTPQAAALTTVTPGALAFAHLVSADDNTPTITSDGWVYRGENLGGAECQCVGLKTIPAAGSTGAINFALGTNGPDASKVATFAIRPAAA